MTPELTVSIVIVSRHRPKALRRCLIGVSQLAYHPFEVIVVADSDSCAGLRSLPQAAHVKVQRFDHANISAARNAGVMLAAGDIIAFIDDDAVPEPTWLTHLIAPFADVHVMAAGGFVRGRNGISWQSRAKSVDRSGQDRPIVLSGSDPTVLTPTQDQAIRTEGTNMAIRRSALSAVGGFDVRYRFFLDETDLNMRLAKRGWSTAIVPLAQVHHGYLESDRRRADRVPTDLTEIGASWAVFLTTYCPKEQIAPRWVEIQTSERKRLIRHMVSGALEPRDVRRLIAGLIAGYDSGLARQPTVEQGGKVETQPFLTYPNQTPNGDVLFFGRVWSLTRLRNKARRAVETGHRVSLYCFSHSAMYHHVRFTDDGYWEQTGGLFGRSDRSQPLFKTRSFSGRLAMEKARTVDVRTESQV